MALKNQVRDTETGRFVRTVNIWDGSNWDEGYHDRQGRFLVYCPDYPKVYRDGYAMRSRVIWWLIYGMCPDDDVDVHHKNRVRDDDRLENLQLLSHSEHGKLHNPGGREMALLVCPWCHKEFKTPTWRLRCRWKAGSKTRYCSQKCYHATPRTEEHKRHIGEGNARTRARMRKMIEEMT